MPTNIFIRQPFTQSDSTDTQLIQSFLDELVSHQTSLDLNFLSPMIAEDQNSFKQSFEKRESSPFTPENFRNYRLSLLDQADAFINIRTGFSESGAFEMAYHIFKGNRTPMFFAIWDQSPIKTTLIRELDDLVDVEYHVFNKPSDIFPQLRSFLENVYQHKKIIEKELVHG